LRFWRTLPGTLLLVLLLGTVVGLGVVGFQIHQATHPPRQDDPSLQLAGALVKLEEVAFDASDGVRLSAWYLAGEPDQPVVVLCHDLGESKGSLINLAIALQKAGFHLLVFDFRGHGGSGGGASGLGLAEKRDVLGAVDYLASRQGLDGRRLGIYGVGMGAHAVVLAAADRPSLRVLVLDGLYPDVGYPLVRKVYDGWPAGARRLGWVPRLLYEIAFRSRIRTERAADLLPRLSGRDMLLVAPAGDSSLSQEIQSMYESVPEHRETDTNLITLSTERLAALRGDELERYHARVVTFFESRLARQ
jgi:uncharacterized protein